MTSSVVYQAMVSESGQGPGQGRRFLVLGRSSMQKATMELKISGTVLFQTSCRPQRRRTRTEDGCTLINQGVWCRDMLAQRLLLLAESRRVDHSTSRVPTQTAVEQFHFGRKKCTLGSRRSTSARASSLVASANASFRLPYDGVLRLPVLRMLGMTFIPQTGARSSNKLCKCEPNASQRHLPVT